jgi:hypothetical protein
MSDTSPYSSTAKVYERSFVVPVLALLALVLYNLLWSRAIVHFQVSALLAATVVGVWGWRKVAGRSRDTRVALDDGVLRVGRRSIARTHIIDGELTKVGDVTAVQLRCRWPRSDLELRFDRRRDAKRLLKALAIDGSSARSKRFRTLSPVLSSNLTFALSGVLATFGCIALIPLALGGAPPLALAGAGALLASLIASHFVPSYVEVGADGVLLSWLGRKRFISHSDYDRVSVNVSGFGVNPQRVYVVLHHRDGRRTTIAAAIADGAKSDRLARRIRAAKKRYQRGSPTPRAARLSRATRPSRDWVEELQRAVSTPSHRKAALDRDTLWRIVEDPKSEEVDRAAAAVALMPDMPARERTKLRAVVTSTVSPRLRIALDSVAEERDAQAVAEALEQLDDEAPRERA